MKIPLIYNLRSIRQRPVSTAATALGMAVVVAVFIAMMALSNGFKAALVKTGSSDNAFILRKGAQAEMNSGIDRHTASVIASLPFVAADETGRPLVSPEIFVVVGLTRLNGGFANVVVRGISPQALKVRKGITITDGRMFQVGAPEILVGATLARSFPNTGLGDRITFGGRDWTVVGHFTANGSSFESEIWGENEQFMPVFRGEVFQSVTFRMKDPAAFDGVKQTLETDPRITVDVAREIEFYEGQSRLLSQVLGFIAVFISGVMAVGAIFGAVNTMYAAVASRAPEIGVLLTLGFRPRSVMSSFLAEAMIIALIGGVIGALLALPINGLVTSTTNWNSFSEVAFAFRVTPALLLSGLGFSVVMGLLGGYFPARRAAKQEVVEALRAEG
ncbi:MAG: ABC transporter permease [Gemmatimonadetes bacterium]|nr:ABC transporter permease [Gemmatimonadota bacterium]